MAISANVKGIMDQLGIYVDIVAIGKPVTHVQTFQSDLSLFMDNDLSGEACADGAHLAVRRHLYEELKERGLLLAFDDVALPFRSVCLVGQTDVLDPEEFPDLKLEKSQLLPFMGDSQYNYVTFTTKTNRRLCYMILQFLDKESIKSSEASRNSE
ncbi:hypothetical protein CPB97_002857 [Podila verticillata]|nr:hypothetical protein CPB97_002857 [Podila verticillata]